MCVDVSDQDVRYVGEQAAGPQRRSKNKPQRTSADTANADVPATSPPSYDSVLPAGKKSKKNKKAGGGGGRDDDQRNV